MKKRKKKKRWTNQTPRSQQINLLVFQLHLYSGEDLLGRILDFFSAILRKVEVFSKQRRVFQTPNSKEPTLHPQQVFGSVTSEVEEL